MCVVFASIFRHDENRLMALDHALNRRFCKAGMKLGFFEECVGHECIVSQIDDIVHVVDCGNSGRN